MTRPTGASLDEIRERIDQFAHWYHRIELIPGVVTPGIMDSALALTILDQLGLPDSLNGLRALDIGCKDGAFSFALEQRGAKVMAIDYAEREVNGFALASEILGSQVEFRCVNVYDVDPERLGTFDVVLFLGVLYHLRNPLLAFDRIRSVCKPGTLLFVETQIATAPALHQLQEPVWQFYLRDALLGDATNKWAPNMPGLRAMVEESQFEVLGDRRDGDRGWCVARAVWDDGLDYFRRLDGSKSMWGWG
jgi:tRNA (mo5U34)-methyltransferase